MGAYYDENYKRKYVYAHSQKEAKQLLSEKMATIGYSKGEEMTLADWVFYFLEEYKKNEIKVTTYDSYMMTYRVHIKNSDLGKTLLLDLDTAMLQKYYNSRVRTGANAKTVIHSRTVIGSALDQAVKMHLIPVNPNKYTTAPKKKTFEAKVLDKSDIMRFVAEAKDEPLYPIIITTVYTGMRKGEVMGLRWQDVDFDKREIHVRHSLCKVLEAPDETGRRKSHYELLEPKSKKSIRTIPMLDEVYEALQLQKMRQKEEKRLFSDVYIDRDYIFADQTGNYLPQRTFMTDYHRLQERYQLPKVRFHDLRHSFATLLIEANVSMKVIQELLGHSTITTSMDLYAHVSEKMKRQALEDIRKITSSNGDQ